jgi:hypothetical protein
MLLASIGVPQNPTTMAPRTPQPTPTTRRANRRPQGLPHTVRAATAATLTTPPLPHPPMEAHIRVTSHRPRPLRLGHHRRTLTRHTPSPEDGITRRNPPMLPTQPPLLIPMDARRPRSPLPTLPQVPQQPLQATTLPRMVGSTPFHNNLRRHATHSLAPLGTVQDRHDCYPWALLLFPPPSTESQEIDTLSFQAAGWCSGVWPPPNILMGRLLSFWEFCHKTPLRELIHFQQKKFPTRMESRFLFCPRI